jgi:nucleotide-binding universal stress UspA family protein
MKVLLAIDGSESAVEAAKFLRRLPHRDPFTLFILTVTAMPDVPMTATTDLWYSKYAAGQKILNEQAFSQVASLFQGLNGTVEHVSKQGHAGHHIVATADELQADLVVVGSKGHTQVERILLGSTSDFVATHSTKSVLVVRPSTHSDAPEAKLKITIAYDESKYSDAAIHQFSEFQWAKNSEVEVLTIVPRHRIVEPGLFENSFDQHEAIIRNATQAAELASRSLRKQLIHATTSAIEADHVAEKIVELTGRSKPDLIVLGDRGRSGIARMLLGSVSQYVLRYSTQSVWIARSC